MLDLKSKLAAAGLVTKEDVDRAEKAQSQPGKRKKKRRGGRGGAAGSAKDGSRLPVAALRNEGKGQRYDAVRRFVERTRLDDPARPPTDQAKTFHFATAKGSVGRLVVEPDVRGWLEDGGAGIVAYMSNHGLAHAPVPAQAARDVAELFPLWLRVLKGHPGAGKLEADEVEATEATGAAAPAPDAPPNA